MRRAAVGWLVLVAALAGCTSGGDRTAGVQIEGARPHQEALIEEILDNVGEAGLAEVRLRPPHTSWASSPEPDDVEIFVRWTKEGGARSRWNAWLLAMTFADRSREQGLPRVVAGVVNGHGSNFALGDGPGSEPDCVEVPRDPVESFVAAQEDTLASFEQIDLGHGLEAVAIVIRTQNPVRFLKETVRPLWEVVPFHQGCGTYVEVVDPAGGFVYRWTNLVSSTLTQFSEWVRPALEDCLTFPQGLGGSLFAKKPPPCPE
jgi:hypothetical protein